MFERRCICCQIEFNIPLNKGDRVSHGYCARHFIEMMKEVQQGITIAQLLAPFENPLAFCADMSQVFDG